MNGGALVTTTMAATLSLGLLLFMGLLYFIFIIILIVETNHINEEGPQSVENNQDLTLYLIFEVYNSFSLGQLFLPNKYSVQFQTHLHATCEIPQLAAHIECELNGMHDYTLPSG